MKLKDNILYNKIIGYFKAMTEIISVTSIDFGHFDGSFIKNMKGFFSMCYNLKNIDLSNIKVDKIEYMNEMFYKCTSLKYLNLLKFNTKNVKDFSKIFYGCYNLEFIEINNFDTSSAIGNSFEKMFYNHGKLKSCQNCQNNINK